MQVDPSKQKQKRNAVLCLFLKSSKGHFWPFSATLLKDMERGGSYTYSTKIIPAKPMTLETYYKKQSARKLTYLCVIFYQVYSPNVSGRRYWRSRICFWTHLVDSENIVIFLRSSILSSHLVRVHAGDSNSCPLDQELSALTTSLAFGYCSSHSVNLYRVPSLLWGSSPRKNGSGTRIIGAGPAKGFGIINGFRPSAPPLFRVDEILPSG